MYRILWILLLCWCFGCVLGMPALLCGEEPPADAKLQQLTDDARSHAEGMEVAVAEGKRGTKAKLHSNALMKYTDVARQIEIATLWVWQIEGRPVALAKVEAYRRPGGLKWLYCFASTSTGLVEGQWPDGRRFRASKPGIKWTALNGPVPQETEAGRLRQMKALFRRFSVTTKKGSLLEMSNEARPLSRPLFEYSSPKQGVIQGTLCAFVGNGTNPYVIIALEAISPEKGQNAPNSWRYGVVCMTGTGVSVKLDKAEVAHVFVQHSEVPPSDFEKGTFFWADAPKK